MKTVKQVAEFLGVTEHTVLGWIRAGELRAVNVGRSGSGRPSWRVPTAALEAFEAARSAAPVPATRRRKRQAVGGVIEFY